MTFNDDEQIIVPLYVSGKLQGIPQEAGKIQVTIDNKVNAALEETTLKVLLEVTGSGDIKDRPPVDLVTVLDVSGSMNEEDKIGKLKSAMQLLIKKLTPIDRLSVVAFSNESTRLFPLRQVTDKSQQEIVTQVDALKAHGLTNMSDGLKTGVQVLDGRRFNSGRVGAIMLMSDGDQTIEHETGDARLVQVDNFAVYTFGFGSDSKPEVLQDIAKKSKGGTFSDVQNQGDLSKAFSQCLGGLLTVVVQDLNLTIKQVDEESKIQTVSAGNYPQKKDDGSVTILFGDLYNGEVRKVLVDLLLFATKTEKSPDVLEVTYTYSSSKRKRPFEAPPITTTVNRTKTASENEIAKVTLESTRLNIVNRVREIIVLADEKKPEEAKDKVVEAQNWLEDIEVDHDPTWLIETLKHELRQLFKLLITQEIYEKQGRPYALSFETSHDRQRYAARGDLDKVRSFATPRMNAYLEQAKVFEKDPTKPPPSVEDDVKQERLADPLGHIVGPLSHYIKIAIQALKSIDDVMKSSTHT